MQKEFMIHGRIKHKKYNFIAERLGHLAKSGQFLVKGPVPIIAFAVLFVGRCVWP